MIEFTVLAARKDDNDFSVPLNFIDKRIRTHALLSSIGFIILLPFGVLVARYLRTFFRGWFYAHALIQFVIAGPVIIAGWVFGYRSTAILNTGGNWSDIHKRTGLALLILYLFQVFGGMIIHVFKTPRLMSGRRPPQTTSTPSWA